MDKPTRLSGLELVDKGLLTKDQLEIALAVQKRTNDRLGEILVGLNFVPESEMLKYMASRLHTRYITSEKLSQVKITSMILNIVPLAFAEEKNVLPILYEPDKKILSVLMCDPQDEDLKNELKQRTRSADVIAYLALRRTIKAGIKKFYKGVQDAFEKMNDGSLLAMVQGGAGAKLTDTQERQITSSNKSASQSSMGMMRLADELQSSSLFSDNIYIETLNILVGLLEQKPENFRGHSASVAKYTKNIAEKMGLPLNEIYMFIIAGYLHDIGKKSAPHLTLISLRSEEDLAKAKKYYLAPIRLFESIGLPQAVLNTITHLFERYDGRGFPDSLKGDAIPVGSRIIALVDSFEEVLRSPAYADKSPIDALNALKQYVGIFFDPNIYSILEAMLNENVKKPAEEELSSQIILIVDNNQNDIQFLQQRFREARLTSLVATSSDEAWEIITKTNISLIISESVIKPQDGFDLCGKLRNDPARAHIPFIFLSRSDSAEQINKAFEVGADDFVSKPYRSEVLMAKVRRFLAKSKASEAKQAKKEKVAAVVGVSGNLKEIPLPDLVQLFATGRKNGVLTLAQNGEEGSVFLEGGEIINANFKGMTGEKAFYQLIRWEEGTFSLNPDAQLPKREIFAPTPHLIMEGLRIWDEERAGKIPASS